MRIGCINTSRATIPPGANYSRPPQPYRSIRDAGMERLSGQRGSPLIPFISQSSSSTSTTCRIPDDCIDLKRYPLFMARTVLQELIESLQST
jgi:hypothetical protein